MIYYKKYNYRSLTDDTTVWKKEAYSTNIIAFDIESSSILADGEKIGLMYLWQMCLNGDCIYGRTWGEFLDCIEKIRREAKGRIICWIHNLSFEFQFLVNVFNDLEPFARRPRKPIYAIEPKYNIEFRCTLMLFGCKLEKLGEQVGVKKLVGSLDYRLTRTPESPLTKKELSYGERDVFILYKAIQKELDVYEMLPKIPYTKTGKVRRKARDLFTGDKKYHYKVRECQPKDVDEFQRLIDVFAGGYTHANSCYAGRVIENVHSYDFASAYPFIMCTSKFPMSFQKRTIKRFDQMRKDRHYIMCVRFNRIRCTTENVYISSSKCKSLITSEEFPVCLDNGRVYKAEQLTMWLTELDTDIIRRTYEYESYEIIESYSAKSQYLDKRYIMFILDLYGKKTKLKDVAGAEDDYMMSKGDINSLFGMMVTNTIRDDVVFNSDGWQTPQPMTDEEAQRRLDEQRDSWSTFLSFAWGVYVTAYCRHNLWRYAIIPYDNRIIYNDTDSAKTEGEITELIEEWNKEAKRRINEVCKALKINKQLFYPRDTKGKIHPLGFFEHDAEYKRFITLGAKKYCYEDDSGLHITVSGVNKNTGAKALKSIEDFKDGFLFDTEHAGKLTLFYNDDQGEHIVTDYKGKQYLCTDKYGIYLEPTTYRLSITPEYESLIRGNMNANTTHFTRQK